MKKQYTFSSLPSFWDGRSLLRIAHKLKQTKGASTCRVPPKSPFKTRLPTVKVNRCLLCSPLLAFFVVDNLSLGLTGLVTYHSGLESTTYAAMPTLTYYINTGRGFIPYVGLGLGYVGMATKDINVGGLGIGVEAGGVLMLNDHMGIDLGLQYLRQQYPVDEIKSSANTLGATLGVTAFF